MINTHKEFVEEIQNFCNKMELINDFLYTKDVNMITTELANSEPRVFVLGLKNLEFEDEDYNVKLFYKFIVADSTNTSTEAVLSTETENIFIVSALKDYLTYIKDSSPEVLDVSLDREMDDESTYCSVEGSIEFTIKRNPSYWKKMEEYNTD